MSDQLRDALTFYADPANWHSPSTGFAAQYDPEPSPIARDRGEAARRALAALHSDGAALKNSFVGLLACELARSHFDWCDFQQSVERGEAERACSCSSGPMPAALPSSPPAQDET